jgi:hypothetical protein
VCAPSTIALGIAAAKVRNRAVDRAQVNKITTRIRDGTWVKQIINKRIRSLLWAFEITESHLRTTDTELANTAERGLADGAYQGHKLG